MTLPTKAEAVALLEDHVADAYQRYHARMVATVLSGYATHFKESERLWWITGYLHDLDFEEHPREHPSPSLAWFRAWGYPAELIHAVEAHAYGYNGFAVTPQTPLAAALMASDELCGIFYAYQKLNPLPFSEMKVSSIIKRLNDKGFAPKIERASIYRGVEYLGLPLEEHISHLSQYLADLPPYKPQTT